MLAAAIICNSSSDTTDNSNRVYQ